MIPTEFCPLTEFLFSGDKLPFSIDCRTTGLWFSLKTNNQIIVIKINHFLANIFAKISNSPWLRSVTKPKCKANYNWIIVNVYLHDSCEKRNNVFIPLYFFTIMLHSSIASWTISHNHVEHKTATCTLTTLMFKSSYTIKWRKFYEIVFIQTQGPLLRIYHLCKT